MNIEFDLLETKLQANMINSAFDPIRKRFVKINKVKIKNNDLYITGKTMGDVNSFEYKINDLINYGK